MNKSLIIKILIALAIVGTIISHFCKYTEAAELKEGGYAQNIGFPTDYQAYVCGKWLVALESIQKEYEYTDPNTGDWYIAAKGYVVSKDDDFVTVWHVQNYDENGNIYTGKGLLVRFFLTDGSVKNIELPGSGDLNDQRAAHMILKPFIGNHRLNKR
jgi:hypothetical protein|nr:MAG TPA: hypothetical protein [Caudoviricetes sp.]